MKVTISIEVDGKDHGLSIEIDEEQIKEEVKNDTEHIRKTLKDTINTITDHIVNEITFHKEEGEIDLELKEDE